jgi:hypothetical protein
LLILGRMLFRNYFVFPAVYCQILFYQRDVQSDCQAYNSNLLNIEPDVERKIKVCFCYHFSQKMNAQAGTVSYPLAVIWMLDQLKFFLGDFLYRGEQAECRAIFRNLFK